MTTFPNSPRLIKGGIALMHPNTSAILRTIALQYNPDTLSRTLQAQAVSEGGDRAKRCASMVRRPRRSSSKKDSRMKARRSRGKYTEG